MGENGRHIRSATSMPPRTFHRSSFDPVGISLLPFLLPMRRRRRRKKQPLARRRRRTRRSRRRWRSWRRFIIIKERPLWRRLTSCWRSWLGFRWPLQVVVRPVLASTRVVPGWWRPVWWRRSWRRWGCCCRWLMRCWRTRSWRQRTSRTSGWGLVPVTFVVAHHHSTAPSVSSLLTRTSRRWTRWSRRCRSSVISVFHGGVGRLYPGDCHNLRGATGDCHLQVWRPVASGGRRSARAASGQLPNASR